MSKRTNPDRHRAAELQALTGWSWSRCVNLVRKYPALDVTDIVRAVERQ